MKVIYHNKSIAKNDWPFKVSEKFMSKLSYTTFRVHTVIIWDIGEMVGKIILIPQIMDWDTSNPQFASNEVTKTIWRFYL